MHKIKQKTIFFFIFILLINLLIYITMKKLPAFFNVWLAIKFVKTFIFQTFFKFFFIYFEEIY